MGFIITYLIIFFRGFILGVSFSLLLKANGLTSIGTFLSLSLPEILIIIPTFIYFSYLSVKMSLTGGKENSTLKASNYLNKLLLITFIIVIYAIIVMLQNNFIVKI